MTRRPPLCEILTDPDGSKHYIVERAKVNSKLLLPQIDVWWNRGARYKLGGASYIDEALMLRQQSNEVENADVIMVTFSQSYALLEAISRAVESR